MMISGLAFLIGRPHLQGEFWFLVPFSGHPVESQFSHLGISFGKSTMQAGKTRLKKASGFGGFFSSMRPVITAVSLLSIFRLERVREAGPAEDQPVNPAAELVGEPRFQNLCSAARCSPHFHRELEIRATGRAGPQLESGAIMPIGNSE